MHTATPAEQTTAQLQLPLPTPITCFNDPARNLVKGKNHQGKHLPSTEHSGPPLAVVRLVALSIHVLQHLQALLVLLGQHGDHRHTALNSGDDLIKAFVKKRAGAGAYLAASKQAVHGGVKQSMTFIFMLPSCCSVHLFSAA